MITIQNQNFGVEIELTGITREQGAKVISEYFGGTAIGHLRDGYDTRTAKDRKGRIWKCSRDTPKENAWNPCCNRLKTKAPKWALEEYHKATVKYPKISFAF